MQPLHLTEQADPLETAPDMNRPAGQDTKGACQSGMAEAAAIEANAGTADLARIERNAFESGFRQGEKAGGEIAEKKMEAVMRRYGDSIQELGKAKSGLYCQVEREVVRLAVEVAKKIVHREIQVDPEIVQTLVRVALDHAAERSVTTIRVSPIDHKFLVEKHPGWEKEADGGREVVLIADKGIERGGCLLQTDCGEIDARIEEKFREVERAFFEGCPQAEP